MIIELSKLHYLIDKYIDELLFFYYSDTVIGGKKYKAGTQILLLHANQLLKSGARELDTLFNITLYEHLIKEFPADYRRPVKWVDSATLEHSLQDLEQINLQTKRKRYLTLVGDVYRKSNDGKTSQPETVFKHGDRLDYQKWKTHRVYIDTTQKFFIRNSENGIIVFGGAASDGYIDENDSHSKRLDLTGSMMSHKFDKKFDIAADFIPQKDVYKIDNPGMLAEEYINTNARLIIFNENLTAQQKEALLQVKRYDPFVRMMVVPKINPANISDLILQLKMVYNTDYWKK